MKYIYDSHLDTCPSCYESWYIEEDDYFMVSCKCGLRTAWHSSMKRAEMEWNKFLFRDIKLNELNDN